MNLFSLKRPVSAFELVHLLHISDVNDQIIGNGTIKVNKFAPIKDATQDCIAFADPFAFRSESAMLIAICDSKARIIIMSQEIARLKSTIDHTFIVTSDPRKTFINLINKLGIIPTDYITIGKHCTISQHAIIGDIGFGHIIRDMTLPPFPQIGYINIEDRVRIQAFTAINRGSLGTTHIGKDTWINKFVNIGHNDQIGQHCIIQPHTCLCGSVTIGDNTWIGPGVTIKDHINIGNNCIIGAGSVVVNDVPNGKIVKGNPAK